MKLQLHRHRNLLAGFFVSTAVVTFVVSLIVLFHKKGVFEMQYTLSAVFENGVGLRPGADVLFNGVKIGRVESVNLFGQRRHRRFLGQGGAQPAHRSQVPGFHHHAVRWPSPCATRTWSRTGWSTSRPWAWAGTSSRAAIP